jgi:HAD superfamily hydrolase (TIGR01549 family)
MLDLHTKIKALPLEAIVFDLDDTLYDSRPIYELGLRRAFATWSVIPGLPAMTESKFCDAYNTGRSRAKDQNPTSPCRHNRLIYFNNLCFDVFGCHKPEIALNLHEAYWTAYDRIDFSVTRRLLEQLKPRYKIAIATNQTLDAQIRKLKNLDPEGELIDAFVTSEEVGTEKPAPDIFKEVLHRLHVRPQNALMIGDSFEADIQGALDFGMPSIHIDLGHTSSSPVLVQDHPLCIRVGQLQDIAALLTS